MLTFYIYINRCAIFFGWMRGRIFLKYYIPYKQLFVIKESYLADAPVLSEQVKIVVA